MKVEIRRSFGASNAGLRAQVEERIGVVMRRFADRVARVRLFFEDTNGPRGGVDLRCCAIAKVDGIGHIVVVNRDESLPALVNTTIERLGAAVRRRIKRRRNERSSRQS